MSGSSEFDFIREESKSFAKSRGLLTLHTVHMVTPIVFVLQMTLTCSSTVLQVIDLQ